MTAQIPGLNGEQISALEMLADFLRGYTESFVLSHSASDEGGISRIVPGAPIDRSTTPAPNH
jgi:hypothetical protein